MNSLEHIRKALDEIYQSHNLKLKNRENNISTVIFSQSILEQIYDSLKALEIIKPSVELDIYCGYYYINGIRTTKRKYDFVKKELEK